MPTVTVPVKSAVTSKVNWVAGIGAAITCATTLAPQILPFVPPPYGALAAAILTAAATIYARTFHTTAILTPSARD